MSKFVAVKDGRGRKIRGLWERGNKFYAQITTVDPAGVKAVRRIPLDASNVPDAKIELGKKRLEQAENGAVAYESRSKTFAAVADQWLRQLSVRPATEHNYRNSVGHLNKAFGSVPVAQIGFKHVADFKEQRAAEVVGGTFNLDMVALRQVLGYAVSAKYISRMPEFEIPVVPYRAPRRALLTQAHIDLLAQTALENGDSVRGPSASELIRFLSYTGARHSEALHCTWADVDFEQRYVRFGKTKNGDERYVHFNPKLEALLQGMLVRCGDKVTPTTPLFYCGHEVIMNNTIKAAGLESLFDGVKFHLFRHFFISMCVMSGIDFMTIAKWVGHKDGGILIGKVYGHLNNEHMTKAAAKVNFQ